MFAYVNGEYVDERDATISIFDRGFLFGDGVFDTTRTFGGVPFRLEDHLLRLGRSMRWAEIDADPVLPAVHEAAAELVSRNKGAIAAAGDVFVHIVVTRGGLADTDYAPHPDTDPTVVLMLRRIEFSAFAARYESGVDLGVSLLTAPFAGAVDPRVKSLSRLAWVRADLSSARATRAGRPYWPLFLAQDGSFAEVKGSNLAMLEGDVLVTPQRGDALDGISLQTLVELARGLGFDARERRITLYDLLNADEAFLTSTSFSILPVARVDNIPVQRGEVYSHLLTRWKELVDFDFVAQARELAVTGPSAPAAADPTLSASHSAPSGARP